MLDEQQLLKILNSELEVGDTKYNSSGITVGVVVDTDDPLQNGRLRVFCANLNDDPKKIHHLPWASYVSPYGGVISNGEFTRGTGKGPEKSQGAIAYGFWAIPEQGSLVLVTCIDGDERRRVWMGCMQPHREMHSLFHGRYDWKEGGTVDGPLTSTKNSIEPQYTNAEKAFRGEKDSAEWKTRQSEYQATGNVGHEEEDMIDQQYPEIRESEGDEWVKPIVGAHGYDWSGNKALGSFLASRVFGFSTPGFHAFTMDDRPYNNRIRLRSSTGHQIILDDTNERIYVATNEGKSWIEMDSNGNIDGYSERRISMRAKEDINFSTDGTFRVKANKGIYMYAGNTEGQASLDSDKPEDGEIRLHSTADTHILVEKNLRTLVYENKLEEIAKDICQTVGGGMFIQVDGDANTILNGGNYSVSVDGDYNHHASGNTSIFSGNDNIMQSVSDTKIFSFTGKMDIGSLLDMSIKTYEGDLTLEALEENMKLMSNNGANQITMRNPFMNFFSVGQIVSQSAKEIAQQTNDGFGIDGEKRPTIDGNLLGGGCISLTGGVNVSFKPTEINFDALDNIQMAIDNSAIATSVQTINDNFNSIQGTVNDLAFTVGEKLAEIVGVSNPLDILDITIPALPTFPSVPTLRIPSLDLPEFNFNFCIDVGNFSNIENFNPVPDGLFLNIDLGGWTQDNFKSWFDRQKLNFENSIDVLDIASNQVDMNINNAIDNIKNNINQIKDSLENLVNINITDNSTHIASYTTGIGGLNDSLASFNSAVNVFNENVGSTVVPRLTILQNETNDHLRSLIVINTKIQETPATVNGLDYTSLEEQVIFFNAYSNAISEFGGP